MLREGPGNHEIDTTNEIMGILWLMPNYKAYSESWMTAMVDALQSRIAAIGSRHCASESYWGDIPVLDIGYEGNLLIRGLRRLRGSRVDKRGGVGYKKLRRLAGSTEVTTIVIHYCDFAVELSEILAAAGKPIWIFCHGIDVTWDMRRWTLAESPYHPEKYTENVRRLAEIAMFIANSERTAERLREVGVPKNRIAVRHLGVKIDPRGRKKSKVDGPVKIISVGRMVDFKGFDRTIRAYEMLAEKVVDAELHLVGDGYMGPFCRMLAMNSKFHDKIEFHGVVSNSAVRRLLKESDIFTMHSQKGPISNQEEAFGVAFLEAMAEGLPVVAGRSGGVPEIVLNGETGMLFPPGDTDAHAESLEYLCRDVETRQRMGRVGFERASKLFRFEDAIQKVCSLLGSGVG